MLVVGVDGVVVVVVVVVLVLVDENEPRHTL
jgi:hypothetical protein